MSRAAGAGRHRNRSRPADREPGAARDLRKHDKIVTTVEATGKGVLVVQTSTDAQVVAALQQHAAEVTEFINEGMAAMHKAMMKNGGMMQPGMHDGMMGNAPQGKTPPTPR